MSPRTKNQRSVCPNPVNLVRRFVDLTTDAQDQKWGAIRLLELDWSGEDGDAAQSMGHLRTLMGQMAGSDASVRL